MISTLDNIWLITLNFFVHLRAGALNKAFWTIAIFTFAGALIQNMVGLAKNYFGYPVSTSVTIVNLQQVVFSAVTFCNMNPIKRSALESFQGATGAKKRRKRVGGERKCSKARISMDQMYK